MGFFLLLPLNFSFLHRQSLSDDTTGASGMRTVGTPCACLLPASCPAWRALHFCPALGQGLTSQRGHSPTLCVREQPFALDAAGRRGDNLRACNQTTPYCWHSLHSQAVLITQSKAGKNSNSQAFPRKCPFPFPFHIIVLWPIWSDFMPEHALGGLLPAAACQGTW